MIKNNTPLVSIALCTYNGEKYLNQQLNSIIHQTYPNLEIIIVDDASTDGTINIINSFQEKVPIIKLYKNEYNIGFNKNFKKSLDLCSADYIAIADQDDIWKPEKIEILLKNLGDNLLIYHDSEYIDNNGKPNGKSMRTYHRFVAGFCAKKLIYSNCVSGHASLLRKELIELSKGFNHCFYYDWWLAYTAACTGRINYIEQKLVQHRQHSESSTKLDFADARQTRIKQIKLYINHLLTPEPLRKLLQNLLDEYIKLNHKKFSFKLLWLLIINAPSLFYIRKKSIFTKISNILLECKSINKKLLALNVFNIVIDATF